MAKSTQRSLPKRIVVPDRLDLRDRPYMPAVDEAPSPVMRPKVELPVLHQKDTNACTGFALSNVVNFLLRISRREASVEVSPFMLYSMARRYDEFPGSTADSGSSLRGAMKGWYKHGSCRRALWRGLKMPPPAATPESDWWLDAALRPLGAYYRVDTRSVTDMHVALSEVGVLYASVVCHDGWLEGMNQKPVKGSYWTIPEQTAAPNDGGHAFIILGYNETGFIIQNSWGTEWGTGGQAVLTYQDWTENAMDCWVGQLGVVTEQHKALAKAVTLRTKQKKVQLASDTILRNRELSPFIIDMENNGELSKSGTFRTQPSDVEALVNFHIDEARQRWGLGKNDPADVAVYAHGGLTDEDTAANTAAKWIPKLYEAQIFPIFFMWETDLWSTLKNRLEDLVLGLPKPTAGLFDQLARFWNQRLERLLAPVGSAIWGEMKQNADAISSLNRSGARILYDRASKSTGFARSRVRLHLIGHSAGSIVHSYLVDHLGRLGWNFESVNFLAPAVTVELFSDKALARIKDGTVKQFRTFHLTEAAEQQDPTCRPILGYGRSLLYLVSESFENGIPTPILGIEKHFKEHIGSLKLKNVQSWSAPTTGITSSTTHGGFDDDETTMKSVISLIKKNRLP